jgi:hypothetical protein
MIEVTAFRSDHDCMGSIIGMQLRENALHMSFHRIFRDEELVRDDLV